MYLGLYQPADVIEEKGADYFIAAHPRPRAEPPGFLQVLLGARHSLIGNWIEDHYRSCVDSYRILRRQSDPPPLNWSTLKYVLWQRGGSAPCRGSVINPKRS